MHTIETKIQVNKDHVLNISLPDDIEEGMYQVVIVMNPQSKDELDDETPDKVAIEGIKEGLTQAFTGEIIPLDQMWEGIDVK